MRYLILLAVTISLVVSCGNAAKHEGARDSKQPSEPQQKPAELPIEPPADQRPSPPPTPPTSRDTKWSLEPNADADCNGKDCNTVINELLRGVFSQHGKALSLVINQRTSALAHLKLNVNPGDGLAQGTFTVETLQLPFKEGIFEVRNGRLALRTHDSAHQLYFTWYPTNEQPALYLHKSFSARYGRLSLLRCCLPVEWY